ncbi:hypothetical protein ANCCAN_24880 [Ancylostoma caninum]|uniref:Uncharacterized protein n=1 Tax=Ancylostoma caninum TaxID=29170 RepID=A0A368FB42_ANCCA|nr:hypothetical protein ANCCAN_24880 [Ancylostoma caninum]
MAATGFHSVLCAHCPIDTGWDTDVSHLSGGQSKGRKFMQGEAAWKTGDHVSPGCQFVYISDESLRKRETRNL